MKKKKNSRKMKINTKISNNNNIYFISADDSKLELEDNSIKIVEKLNDTGYEFVDQNSNKSILLKNGKLSTYYENKYTIDKQNLINKKLTEYYCNKEKVDSNIYIQIIHNCEDIKKILSLYINDVIYCLYSISRINIDEESNEFIIYV